MKGPPGNIDELVRQRAPQLVAAITKEIDWLEQTLPTLSSLALNAKDQTTNVDKAAAQMADVLSQLDALESLRGSSEAAAGPVLATAALDNFMAARLQGIDNRIAMLRHANVLEDQVGPLAVSSLQIGEKLKAYNMTQQSQSITSQVRWGYANLKRGDERAHTLQVAFENACPKVPARIDIADLPPEAAPAATDKTKPAIGTWELSRTVVDDEHRSFSTPIMYQGKSYGTESWTVAKNNFQYSYHKTDSAGKVERSVKFALDFEAPKPKIVPGDTFNLKITGTESLAAGNGADPWAAYEVNGGSVALVSKTPNLQLSQAKKVEYIFKITAPQGGTVFDVIEKAGGPASGTVRFEYHLVK